MHRTNPGSLIGAAFVSRVFRLSFASVFFKWLLVRFHQAEMIIVNNLIEGRNNEAWVGVEPTAWPS